MTAQTLECQAPRQREQAVQRAAEMLRSGGVLIAGFQLSMAHMDIEEYDRLAQAAGLLLMERWSTWDRQPFAVGDYAVSVHRRA